MDITEVLTKGGPEAIIAALFIYVLTLILKNVKEQRESHRQEIKEMRAEQMAQVTSLTDKFSSEIKSLSAEFSSGMASMKDGLNQIADELRDVKVKVQITAEMKPKRRSPHRDPL